MTEQQILEAYLARLRSLLPRSTLAEREEIVREIRAHVLDSCMEPGATVLAVLQRLGSPEELALCYADGFISIAAASSRLPVRLLGALSRLVACGLTGSIVFVVGAIGYLVGGAAILTAFLKLLFPANVGTWIWNGHFVASGLLFPVPPPGAQELLGWHYIPVMLTAGAIVLALTHLLLRAILNLSRRLQAGLSGVRPEARAFVPFG